MRFVQAQLWKDGKLLATCKDGKAHLNAYLDDHAYLLNASLELLQAEFRSADLKFARQLADAMLTRFEDPQHGGFFFTSHDHEALIQRSKVAQDSASPSGNGMAAQALQRLSVLTGDSRYSAAAERCLKRYLPALEQAGSYHSSLCTALAEYLQPVNLLVLCRPEREVAGWHQALCSRYLPDVMVITLTENMGDLPEALNRPVADQTTAWLCQGTQCLAPIAALDELRLVLQR